MREEIENRLALNLGRVGNLIRVYEGLSGKGQGRRPVHSSDILRAATVLLHATVEDFLRSIELWKLPAGSEEALSDIPLVGTQGRPDRLSLGKLTPHRTKSVDTVIMESVAQYLERKSYNDTTDVMVALQRLGIDSSGLKAHLPQLSSLIERRHHIVHQADREKGSGSGHHPARSISKGAVLSWLEAVKAGTSAVLSVTPD